MNNATISKVRDHSKKVRMIFTLSIPLVEKIRQIPKGQRSELVEEAITAKFQSYKRKKWYKKYGRKNINIKIQNNGWGENTPNFSIR